jgi:hypothetical protein
MSDFTTGFWSMYVAAPRWSACWPAACCCGSPPARR